MDMEAHEERPRAYYPDGTDTGPAAARTPGWDVGPERRIDDGTSLARGLGWLGITALAVVAGVAARKVLAARKRGGSSSSLPNWSDR